MVKIKTLSNMYIRPEPFIRETSVHLKLHILASQMDRLNNTKEACLNKVDQINKRLLSLKQRYSLFKKMIE